MNSIKKVLIANRGEIALRINRAAKKLGITPVMLASEADATSCHATTGDEVLHLPGKSAADTYLNAEKIVSLASEARCDAVHPGYGFLSENGDFAELVEESGMKFIGPSAEVIRLMGDKVAAKQIAAEAGVPMANSTAVDSPQEALATVQSEIGFPILLKAKAGGGGRGMRLVRQAEDFVAECERAQAEAKKFFGNEAIFAERYIDSPRHVEVQVFGDGKGNAVHIGTRDCSAQRRHQKLVEEAPAPFLSDDIRKQLHESAVSLAAQVNYEGAGTVEFLVQQNEEGNDALFFLEMNTRIQVEHPVTEEVYDIDLVEWQFRIAMGEPLVEQAFIKEPHGHAIELRVYAENPAQSFSPELGTLQAFKVPHDPHLREDGGVQAGSEVTPYYDALLTKLIVTGKSRDDALQNVRRVLKQCTIEGLKTTLPFHLWLTHESPFSTAPLDIGFIDSNFTAESLTNVHLYERINAEHKTHTDYAEAEILTASGEDGKMHQIEVLHRKDGLFEGSKRGSSEKESRCISQTKTGAIRSVLTNAAVTV